MNPDRAVGIDFDKVIHSYTRGWTGEVPEDLPVPGAKMFILWLLAKGYEPFVFTTRALTGRGRIEVEHWLTRHGFPHLYVTAQKLPAILYLDDKNLRFDGEFITAMRILSSLPDSGGWCEGLCPH